MFLLNAQVVLKLEFLNLSQEVGLFHRFLEAITSQIKRTIVELDEEIQLMIKAGTQAHFVYLNHPD